MSIGFGFSAGDFIAGLTLVNDIIAALKESTGAGVDFRLLVEELEVLKSALEQVQGVQLDQSLQKERFALEQAASLCQRTITDFWQHIST
ncbi:hypothetical protein MMC11_002076 [Xylographa trunciseda]|nr:hypothetical protein [Xylographa trunciseda]